MSGTIHLDARPLVKAALSAGWRPVLTKRAHLCLPSPDGAAAITISGAPSDRRAVRAMRSDLRRAGVSV